MKDKIGYLLTKRFKAYIIGLSVICILFILKEIGDLQSDFVLQVITAIQVLTGAYMGVQTVSDTIMALKGNKKDE